MSRSTSQSTGEQVYVQHRLTLSESDSTLTPPLQHPAAPNSSSSFVNGRWLPASDVSVGGGSVLREHLDRQTRYDSGLLPVNNDCILDAEPRLDHSLSRDYYSAIEPLRSSCLLSGLGLIPIEMPNDVEHEYRRTSLTCLNTVSGSAVQTRMAGKFNGSSASSVTRQ